MAKTFKSWDVDQVVLLPPSVQELVPVGSLIIQWEMFFKLLTWKLLKIGIAITSLWQRTKINYGSNTGCWFFKHRIGCNIVVKKTSIL